MIGRDAIDLLRFDHSPFDGGAIGTGRRVQGDPSELDRLFVILTRGPAIGVVAP